MPSKGREIFAMTVATSGSLSISYGLLHVRLWCCKVGLADPSRACSSVMWCVLRDCSPHLKGVESDERRNQRLDKLGRATVSFWEIKKQYIFGKGDTVVVTTGAITTSSEDGKCEDLLMRPQKVEEVIKRKPNEHLWPHSDNNN